MRGRHHRSTRSEAEPPQSRSRASGWAIAAALAVVAIILYAVRVALLPFVFSAAIAFVTDPVIEDSARRLGWPRWLVATLLYVLLLIVLGVLGYWVATTAVPDLIKLVGNAPDMIRNLIAQAVGPNGISLFGTTYKADDIMRALGSAVRALAAVGALTKVGELTLGTVLGFALTLVLAPYFMISGPRLAAGAIWLIPPERRRSIVELLPKIVPVLRRYLVGIAIVVFYAITIAWIGFGLIFGLPAAGLLAVAVGLLELIPVVGPLTSAALVGIVAVQQQSLTSAALLMAFAILLRLSIDNLIGPLVLGSAARLHPVVIIAAFVCGGILFGIVGLLLAVPTAVCIKITLQHYYAEPVRTESE
ncbi:MAG TPA: AI-2E family transporter [Stellaceae bacterium]|nr:AI-2E family transporter [Stellaceae bacterium]